MELSNSKKEYIKAIYSISEKEEVKVTSIANELGISKPSVISALQELRDKNLVIYNHGYIKLTDLGLRYANNINRKNDILNKFFTDILKVDEKRAMIDAFNMKNNVSCQTITKLEKYLIEKEGIKLKKYESYCVCDTEKSCGDCHKN